MDTKLYAGHDLDMIRKAVEVQELWEPEYLDFFVWNQRIPCSIDWNKRKKDFTWLPRQDQLWPMLPKEIEIMEIWPHAKVKEGNAVFIHCQKIISAGIVDHFELYGFTMEQALLKMVYKSLYNKTWLSDKNDWKTDVK